MRRRIILIAVLLIIAWVGISWFFMWPPVCREDTAAYLIRLRCIDAGAEQRVFAYCESYCKTSLTHWDYDCVVNLYQINEVKKQWAHANHKTNGDDVVVTGVNELFPLHHQGVPFCSDGGRYDYNRIGEYPTCTLDGKMLSARPVKVRTSLFTWASAPYNPEPHRHSANLDSELAKAIMAYRK